MTSASPSGTISLRGHYGFAKLDNDIFLVQLVDSSPAPRTYRVHVFRHDFVSVFPYSHTQTISSSDLLDVLENEENGERRCWLEEGTATVFVARDVMGQFIRLKDMLAPTLERLRPPKRRVYRLAPHGRVRSGMAAV